jgi:hypothetical protein
MSAQVFDQAIPLLIKTHNLALPCKLQTQHKVEMDKRDGTLNTMSAPPMQQMSRW